MRRIGLDLVVVGKVIRANKTPVTIVGVLAPEFSGGSSWSWVLLTDGLSACPGSTPQHRHGVLRGHPAPP